MAEVGAVTDEYDIPLVVDEIQSGVGRTGEFWASEHYDIEPDVITAAKGLRVGATVARSELFPDEKNRLGSTFGGGDLLASMMGTLTIEAIQEHDLLANATDPRPSGDGAARGRPPGLGRRRPRKGADARGRVRHAGPTRRGRRRGAGARPAHARLWQKTIRLLPPLDSTEREIELGVSIFVDAAKAADSASIAA